MLAELKAAPLALALIPDELSGLDAGNLSREDKKAGFRTRYALFLLPLITVLREGLETVIFVGGVSLGQEAKSIPLATIVGLLCGIVVGYLLYRSSSRLSEWKEDMHTPAGCP